MVKEELLERIVVLLVENSIISGIDSAPVDYVPQRIDTLNTGVAVVDVVGVLPHINRQQWIEPIGQRVARVWFAYNL